MDSRCFDEPNSAKRRLTLGTYPSLSLVDARNQVKEIIDRLARGEDPQADKTAEKGTATFGEDRIV